ncbi:hypothetical protein A1Q_1037 [Vibrio campbellii HY01]|nr:hypothetical protein A1Q_1037 [Vibrio campbellii HY01]
MPLTKQANKNNITNWNEHEPQDAATKLLLKTYCQTYHFHP